MNNWKKILASFLALVLVLGGLVACSNETEPAAGEAAEGKVSIRFMVNGSAEELAIYQKAIDAFNAQSEKTVVELVGVTGDDYTAQVMTQLSTDKAPDVFYAEEGS